MKDHCAEKVVLLIAAFLATVSSAMAATPVTPNASPEARALLNFMHAMYGKKTLSGQMWAPWGIDEIETVYKITGKYPAIRGQDYIHERSNKRENELAIEWWKAGGIPTIMWHWGAPSKGEGYNQSKMSIDIDRCFEPGTEEHAAMWIDLKRIADHLTELRDANVPVLWRPVHECDGDWFWYGKGGGERFVKLWRTMFDYFAKERKLNNLVWVLCHSGNPKAEWNPGKEYYDLAGPDTYGKGIQASLFNAARAIHGDAIPIPYHECGTIPDPEECFQNGVTWSWWMLWHTSHLTRHDRDALIHAYTHDLILTRDELPDIMGYLDAGSNPTPAGNDVSEGRVSVKSPDGTIEMAIRVNGPLTYSVSVDGKPVLAESRLGLKFRDGGTLGANARLVKAERSQADTTWENSFGKRRTVRDCHNELRVFFEEPSGRLFAIVVRAFDDGIGFRYVLEAVHSITVDDFVLEEELTRFAFPENYLCYAGENENTGKAENPIGYIGSQESEYKPMRLGELPTDQVRMVPLLVQTPAAWVAITESDLYDWAGMWMSRVAQAGNAGGVTLAARLSPRPDGQGLVKVTFPHSSPWRTLLIAREPGRLIESDLVLNLASPCVQTDTSWIHPGIASWDWWSQVTRPSTATFKELIQFSAEMGWAYVLMDAGWSSRNSIVQGSQSVNMEELLAFAKEKNVRLWLWLHWSSVDRNDAYKEAFALYEKWGIAGVKIDFMNRDDQEMVNWYEKITKAAAEHRLLVNFHGAFKPTGMIRTYPNQITREGILGNEYNRWSARATPEHKTTLPFTRMLAGPGDYTPGGFLNKQLDQFKFNVRPTQVQGTRCAELALFVCLESPVINAADHPNHYRDQPGLDFLKIVPTVWDDTRALDGAVGEHVVIVRRNGDRWFLGALTDRNARDIPVKLDFLGGGSWTMKLWHDAPDSDVEGAHLVTEHRSVAAADTLMLHLARAGGAVACFEPISRQE